MAAIRVNPECFKYISTRLRKNATIAYQALFSRAANIEFVHPSLFSDFDFCMSALAITPEIYIFASNELKGNIYFARAAFQRSVLTGQQQQLQQQSQPVSLFSNINNNNNNNNAASSSLFGQTKPAPSSLFGASPSNNMRNLCALLLKY